jgi:hypothetical protein
MKFAFEQRRFWKGTERSVIRQCLAPVVFAAIGVLLVSLTFSGKVYATIAVDECDTNLDADISGDGVRISIWAQVGVLILISMIGVFHNSDTGIKEVGGGLILTHASLAIALIVQMSRGSLTSVDAAIGAFILDAQNMALQIPLTAKETLAARWQVILLIPTQIIGLTLVRILVVRLNNKDFASESCRCLYVFWWSWLNDCGAFPSSELSAFWVYYAIRMVMFFQSTFHSLWNAPRFHEAEKSEREHCDRVHIRLENAESRPENVHTETWSIPVWQPLWPVRNNPLNKSVSGRSSIQKVEDTTIPGPYPYSDYPASISLVYLLHALFALTSMAVAEITIRDFGLRPSSRIYSVGQIIALVVAAATILRALWKFIRLFFKDRRSFPDFFFDLLSCCCCAPRSKKRRSKLTWPFRLRWARNVFSRKDKPFQDPDARDYSPELSSRTLELKEVEKVPIGSSRITNDDIQTGDNTTTSPNTSAKDTNIRVRILQVRNALRLQKITRHLLCIAH